jgi:alpha-glucosidase
MTFVFNLSKNAQTIPLKAHADIAIGNAAAIEGDVLTLEGNGFVYLSHSGKAPL